MVSFENEIIADEGEKGFRKSKRMQGKSFGQMVMGQIPLLVMIPL